MRRSFLFAVIMLFFVACGADGTSDTQGNDLGQSKDQGSQTDHPLKPPPIDWTWDYKTIGEMAEEGTWTGKVEGTEEIKGKKYYVGSLGTMKDGKFKGVKTWWDLDTKPFKQIGFLRMEYYNGDETPGGFGFAYSCDPVAFGDIPIKPGESGVVEATCDFEYLDQGQLKKEPVNLKVTYQLLATDETVDVTYGSVDGVWHYKYAFIEGSNGSNDPIEGDLWVKPLLGIVKMSEIPGWPFGVELVRINKP